MSTATLMPHRRKMSGAEFLALPDDGVRRMLIRGEVFDEEDDDMSYRTRRHSRRTARITFLLERWLEPQPEPRGEVANGDAGIVLRQDPESIVGADVAYFGPEVTAIESDESSLYDGPPRLAVEVLSPSARHVETQRKIDEYLACGVPLVWIVDPNRRTITVYERGRKPVFLEVGETILAEPHMMGFTIPVAEIFR